VRFVPDADAADATSPAAAPGAGPVGPDASAVMADIEREVRARRRAGQIDDEYERELDRIFDAVAPPGASGSGLESAITRAERAAVIDPDGPVGSRFPGVKLLRRVLRRLLAFYVARQVTAFGVMVVRVLRMLADRIEAIEARSPVTDPRLAALEVPVSSDLDLGPWRDLVVKVLSPAPDRVLHAECGDGALVVALREAGVDAYGVDPRRDAARVADERGAEVRTMAALDHLRLVPVGALGGIVLSGCTERSAVGDLVELVEQAGRALVPGAPIVVVSRGPEAEGADPIAADLAPGRPLHPETWAFLLGRAGFDEIDTRRGDGPGAYALTATRASS
jgi:SAM-dependent methyltransferase